MNILIINANPDKNSFCAAIAESYKEGADTSDSNVNLIHLIDLEFDPILRYGYKKRMELEPDLLKVQEQITKTDHIVLVFPTWWSTFPALLKGFIDRVILPHFAFKYKKGSPLPEKFLKGKSARLITTMDGPSIYYKWYMRSPGLRSIKKGVFEFCGIKPVKTTIFSSLKSTDNAKREKILENVRMMGEMLK
ncbi:MAG: NAD(P)H-dependent oxidoreductase [Candidatus Delongbacteria bacterium]|nr:NAD(P)H-dependent oxidoreductase [Candidatus Delongbacteria bacterium]